MRAKLEWVRMPASLIRDARVLKGFCWGRHENAAKISALLIYLLIIHSADSDEGIAKLTYSDIEHVLGISRRSISDGLALLVNHGFIYRKSSATRHGVFEVAGFQEMDEKGKGWTKVPNRVLYDASGRMKAFRNFSLRSKVSLNALKIYFVLLVFRQNATNLTALTYERIGDYAGLHRNEIKAANSLLIENGLIRVDRAEEVANPFARANHYRFPGLDSKRHAGNTPTFAQ